MRRLVLMFICGLLVVTACGNSSVEETTNDSGDPTTEVSGGDDDGDTSATDATTPSDDSGEDGGSGDQAASGSGSAVDTSGSDTSTATLTIAGETYRFADTGSPGLQCLPSSFGVAFLAALQQVDDGGAGVDGGISAGLPFIGEEETAGLLPEVTASVGEVEWIANPDHAELNGIPASSSQVDAYQIDGNTLSGTATFYEENSSFGDGDLIVESGTFEVTCAG